MLFVCCRLHHLPPAQSDNKPPLHFSEPRADRQSQALLVWRWPPARLLFLLFTTVLGVFGITQR